MNAHDALLYEDVQDSGVASEAELIAPVPRVSIHAFCVSDATVHILGQVAADRRFTRAHFNIHMSDLDEIIDFYQSTPTPDLLLFESLKAPDDLMEDLSRLADVCSVNTKVIVIGQINDVKFYRELIKQGISEYMLTPLSVMQVVRTISSLYNDADGMMGRVIAFIGAKGGVGASTVAHNCGWTIAKILNNDVIIADMDLPFGTTALDFNHDVVQGIVDAVYSPDRLDDVLLDRLLTKYDDSISLLATPAALNNDYDFPPEIYDNILQLLRKTVPVTILDMPHMWSGWVKKVLLEADDVVVVAEPDLANMRNAKELIELIRKNRPNDRPPFLMFNKVGLPKRPEISVRDFSNALNIDYIGAIEFDAYKFGNATNNGQILSDVASQSRERDTFLEMSSALLGHKTNLSGKKKNLLSMFISKLKRSG